MLFFAVRSHMKTMIVFVICLLMLFLLCGCKTKAQNDAGTTDDKSVTFINSVKDADIWILSDTEKNRKTTVWGEATVSKTKACESSQAPLCEPGDDGRYLFRMIDIDSFFYSASGILLEDGWTLAIKGDNLQSLSIEVTDKDGVLQDTYAVFAARL